MGKAETIKDSRDGSVGGQWPYSHGFHFPEYSLGAAGPPLVIKVEPENFDDFRDFCSP